VEAGNVRRCFKNLKLKEIIRIDVVEEDKCSKVSG